MLSLSLSLAAEAVLRAACLCQRVLCGPHSNLPFVIQPTASAAYMINFHLKYILYCSHMTEYDDIILHGAEQRSR